MTNLILEKAGLKDVICFDIKTHIPILEKTLDIQIFLLDHMYKNEFIHEGEPRGTQIYLHLRQNYFDVVTSLTGLFNTDYFCTMCFTPYNHRQKHSCKDHCIVCKKSGCEITDDRMTWRDCHMKCCLLDCFDHHKKPFYYTEGKIERQSPTPCDSLWRCTTCMSVIKVSERKPSEHRCTEYKSKMCSEYGLGQHRCYIRAQSVSNKPFKYIHFNFECMQDEIISCKERFTSSVCQNCERDVCGTIWQDGQTMNCDKGYNPRCIKCETMVCGNYGHTPNVVISQSTCTQCMEVEVPRESKCIHCGPRCTACEKCGFREVMFSGLETANDFCAWLFTEKKQERRSHCPQYERVRWRISAQLPFEKS